MERGIASYLPRRLDLFAPTALDLNLDSPLEPCCLSFGQIKLEDHSENCLPIAVVDKSINHRLCKLRFVKMI